MSADLEAGMFHSKRPMNWIQEWMNRTKRKQQDSLSHDQSAVVDLLMQARTIHLCQGCGVVLDARLSNEGNGSVRISYPDFCSAMCAGS